MDWFYSVQLSTERLFLESLKDSTEIQFFIKFINRSGIWMLELQIQSFEHDIFPKQCLFFAKLEPLLNRVKSTSLFLFGSFPRSVNKKSELIGKIYRDILNYIALVLISARSHYNTGDVFLCKVCVNVHFIAFLCVLVYYLISFTDWSTLTCEKDKFIALYQNNPYNIVSKWSV